MNKAPVTPRFGPERWVTLLDTGEHVKIEAWSAIAAAYRVLSRKRGILFAADDELAEVVVHPDDDMGRHWTRCAARGCGAPLTPELVICVHCQSPTCACGRCLCARKPPPKTRRKATRAKTTPKTKLATQV